MPPAPAPPCPPPPTGRETSAALTGRRLGTDVLGQPILENTIYDPRSERVVNGSLVRDPFSGNAIPKSLIDPVAQQIHFRHRHQLRGPEDRLEQAAAAGDRRVDRGPILRYASGGLIGVPGSRNNLGNHIFQGTRFNRVPGEPLCLTDPGSGNIDPNKELVLNPKAWVDAGPGEWGFSAPYYND